MSKQLSFNRFLYATTAAGLAVVLFSIYRLSLAQLDWRFLVLAIITVGIGSRLSVTIPQVKAEITVADTLVFFAMFLYGAEPAILLAAAEGLVSSWHVSRKSRVFFFNFAQLTCSTFLTAWVLRFFFGPIEDLHRSGHSAKYLAATCVMASVQCIASSGLVALYTALKDDRPAWNTWRRYYLWTSISYFAGASVASITADVIGEISIYAAIIISPIIAIIYFSYRTYLKNVEASAALRKSEERYRDLFENAKDAIYVHDLNGIYTSVNRAAEKLSGYPRDEIIGRHFTNFVAPEQVDHVNRKLARKLSTHRGATYVVEVIARDGRRVPVEVNSNLIYENGRPVGVQGVVRDITERLSAERAIRQAEQNYRDIFENAGEGIFQSTPEGQFLAANPALARMHGYDSPEELIRSLTDISTQIYVDSKRRNEFRHLLAEYGMVRGFEHQVFKKGGIKIWTSVNARAVRDEQGQLLYYEGTAQDITESKRAEDTLREYEKVVEGIEEMIVVIDRDYRYLIANRAFLNHRGVTRDELVGHLVPEFLSEEIFEKVVKKHLDECFKGNVVKYEMRFTYPNLGERDVFISHFPIEGRAGIDRVACIFQDITERKRAEAALQSYPRQLIEAQEAERQSIARELHDQIGQVLTAIHLNLAAVRKSCENLEARVLIDEGVGIVDELLEQVRDLSFELRPSLLDDLGLVAALRWYTDRFARRTGIHAVIASRLPENPTRLSRELETACFRIVQEALTNVGRHARASNVWIKLKSLNDEILLSIKDDGIGFEVDSQNHLHFTTHVGLRGMQERALAVGGRLEVRSSLSGGTQVCANFPGQRDKDEWHE